MIARKWLCVLSVLMMAAGATALPPAGADSGGRGGTPNSDSEPNGDYSTATIVSPSGNTITFTGSASDTDVNDFYKIQLSYNPPNADRLTVDTSCTDGIKRLFLYDPLGRDILLDGDPNPYNTHTVSTVAFTTGYYFVKYEVQGLTAAASYTITFTKSTVTYAGESDSTPSTATPLTGNPASFTDSLDDPNDQFDWYSADLLNDAVSADVVTYTCTPGANLAVRVELYFFNLTYILPFHYEPLDPNDTALGAKDEGSFGTLVNGTYYFRILAVRGSGPYTFKLWKTNVEKDNWNSAETAMGLPGIVDNHYIDFEDTLGKDIDIEDYFSYPASEGQIINATLTSLDYDGVLDRPQISMELRDSTNTTYGTSGGIAKNTTRADGISPETNTASIVRVTLMNYQGGAGRYHVKLTLNMPPAIYENMWEAPFNVNESSNATMDLTTVFYDSDGDKLVYSAENNAGGKTLVKFSGNRATFYTLQPGWTGTENYTVTATDTFGYSAYANILVNVVAVNHAPYVVNWDIRDITCYPGDKLFTTLNLSGNFFDDDILNPALDDYLTYHYANPGDLTITFQLIPGTLKHSGGVTILVPDMPDLTDDLTVTADFWATDNYDLSTPALSCNITILPPVNHEPRWSANFTEIAMNESQIGNPTEVVLDLNNYCTDVDSWDKGLLTYAARSYNVAAFTVALNGSICRITPKAGFYTLPPHGAIAFNATDTKLASAETTIKLIVTHVYAKPRIGGFLPGNGTITIDESQNQSFAVDVILDAIIANLTPQPVKYRWYVNQTIQTATTGTFIFRTDFSSSARSPYNVTFVFNDSQNEVGRFWRVIVQNVNQPPTNVRINSPLWPRLNYTSGDKIMFTAAVALDPDDPNATLTYQWKDGGTVIHTGMSFDTTKLTVGRHAIVLSVTDPDGDTVEAGVTVNIKPAPSKPFIPGMDALAALGALGLLAAVAVALRRRK